MKRTLAITGLAAITALGLAGCATTTNDTTETLQDVVVNAPTPSAAPAVTTPQVNSAPAPQTSTVQIPRESVTPADDGKVIEMVVNQRIPINGLPPEDLTNAVYVSASNDKAVQVQQRTTSTDGTVNQPTIWGIAPGVATITVTDYNPGGNGQKTILTFTIHVQDETGAKMNSGLTGIAAEIASGNMLVGEAVNAAENAGYTVRLVSVDGRQFPITKDIDDKRLNFTVNDGVVTSLTVG